MSAMILAFAQLSSSVEAAVAGVSTNVLTGDPGSSDFGSGLSVGGIPTGPYKVTWDYTPINGVVFVTATVTGTLYLDRFGAGCSRIKINFQDINFNNISGVVRQFCGPGFDANNSANQLAINVGSSNAQIRHVQLVIGSGPNTANIIDDKATTEFFPTAGFSDIINNGTADFGNPPHLLGSPTVGASIGLTLTDTGVITGNVRGVLFWDSTSAGCARLIINFQNVNGVDLTTPRTITKCAAAGGNALSTANQAAVNQSFTSASLFKIRLRVGTVVNNAFVGTVISRNYEFGQPAGSVEGIPALDITKVGENITYGVQWTVPDPENWHSLDILEVRLIDDEGQILQLLWDEGTNTFSQLNPQTERFFAPADPGSLNRFESPAVTMLVQDSEVIDSGPTGPSVLLNLNLRFKPQAAGRTFDVEVRVRDDSGNVQGWDLAGKIAVLD